MIGVIKNKFGPWVVGGIIGLIAFVFIFFGIFTPGAKIMGEAANVAGEVNGETISYSAFSKQLNQRMEFYKNLMGGKVNDEMIRSMGLSQMVYNEMVQQKILIQMAKKEGFYPSKQEVRDYILSMDAFKKDGRFDKVLYKNVLAQNQYTVARFEEMVIQDLVEKKFKSFIAGLAVISEPDVIHELKNSKEKRKIKYVYIDNESVRKTLPKEMKPEEQATAMNQKIEKLTQEITAQFSNDAKLNVLAKSIAASVKTSDWLTSQSDFVPGIGSIKSAKNQIFTMTKADPARAFTLLGGVLVAKVADAETYDAKKITAKEQQEIQNRLQYTQQSEILNSVLTYWQKKSKITQNDKIVKGGQGRNIPVTADQ